MPNAIAVRIPGLLYLVVVLTGIFSLGYVPAQTIVAGDGAATVESISASETLFRFGIAASLICYVAFLLLPLSLYERLRPYGPKLAILMVVLVVVSVPITLLNLRPRLDILTLLQDAPHLTAASRAQLDREVMLALASYGNGILIAKLFWGLWLLPLGILIVRSRIAPRLLGFLLIVGCASYLIELGGQLLVPGYTDAAFRRLIIAPASLGEIGTCLWLTIFGVAPRRDAPAD